MGLASLAIVGRENNPIYFKRLTGVGFELDYIVHSSLDIFQERDIEGNSRDLYLGLLHIIDTYSIYGYTSNSGVKVIVAIENDVNQVNSILDDQIKDLLKSTYSLYVRTVSNPFLEIEGLLQPQPNEEPAVSHHDEFAQKFERKINKLLHMKGFSI